MTHKELQFTVLVSEEQALEFYDLIGKPAEVLDVQATSPGERPPCLMTKKKEMNAVADGAPDGSCVISMLLIVDLEDEENDEDPPML